MIYTSPNGVDQGASCIGLGTAACMVRPCGARGFVNSGRCGLASMYPASDWSVCAPGHHGYQRAWDLISGQASNGPNGSPVFACAGKTDPPSSSHPLADLGG